MSHKKKQEIMAHIGGIVGEKSRQTVSEEIQMLDIPDKNFK